MSDQISNIIKIRNEQIGKALKFSSQYKSYPQYLSIYNLVVGLFALENRIKEHCLSIDFDYSKYTLNNENYCLFLPFISGIKLGKFQGCLIINDSPFDDVIEIPEIAINSSIFSAHFYLVVEMIEDFFEQDEEDKDDEENPEELTQVKILGFVRRDEIIDLKKQIQHSEDGYYQVPIVALDPDFSNLYTYTEYLKYEKIPLAIEAPSLPQPVLTSLQQKINQFLLSNPYFTGDSIWGELNLTPEETLELFNQELLQNQLRESLDTYVRQQTSHSFDSFKNQVINLYAWFTGELDQVARSIGFLNPCPLEQFMTGAFFDDHQDVSEQVLSELIANQEIPQKNGAISRHIFFLKDIEFQLTFGVYQSSSSTNVYGISYILSTKTNPFFPDGLTLKLSDENGDSDVQNIPSGNMYFQQTLELDENEILNIKFSYQDSIHELQFCFSQIVSTSRFLSIPIISISYPLASNSNKSFVTNPETFPQDSPLLKPIFSIIRRLTAA